MKICTGSPLNEHLIDTVFAIFDEDGDGKLNCLTIDTSFMFYFLHSRSSQLQGIHRNHESKLTENAYFQSKQLNFFVIFQDRLHRGFKVSNYKIVDNPLESDEHDDGDGFHPFSLMRSRACRRLRGYLMHLYNDP